MAFSTDKSRKKYFAMKGHKVISVDKLKQKIDSSHSNPNIGKTIGKSELKKTLDTKTDSRVDPEWGAVIANEYEDLKNKPNDPTVRKAKYLNVTFSILIQMFYYLLQKLCYYSTLLLSQLLFYHFYPNLSPSHVYHQ